MLIKLILMALCALLFARFVWALQASRTTNATRPVVGNYRRPFFRRHVRKVYLAPLLIERVAGWLPGRRRPLGGVQFANIGEGTRDNGIKTYRPDAPTTLRYLLYEIGSTPDNCRIAAGVNEPLGPSDDLADASVPDLGIGIKLLGAIAGTTRMVTDGTVTNGVHVCASKADPGYVTAAVAGKGAVWIVGKALVPSDAILTKGEAVEVIPYPPNQVTL